MRLKRPVQTRFRFGSPSPVNLATHRNSQAHSSKGTPSWPPCGDDTLTVCKPTVSGTISLPSRGAFHLSLTVLVRYRWQRVFSLRRWSSRIPARFLVSRGTWVPSNKSLPFRLPDSHRLWSNFPDRLAKTRIGNLLVCRQTDTGGPTTPTKQRLPAITLDWFRLFRFRSPLLTESLLFSFRPATKMFQFTGCPPTILCVQMVVHRLITRAGYPIRKSPDLRLIAAPRGVSSLATSFIGPLPQGIHRAPFVA